MILGQLRIGEGQMTPAALSKGCSEWEIILFEFPSAVPVHIVQVSPMIKYQVCPIIKQMQPGAIEYL